MIFGFLDFFSFFEDLLLFFAFLNFLNFFVGSVFCLCCFFCFLILSPFWEQKCLQFLDIGNQVVAFYLFINHAQCWAGVTGVGHTNVKQVDTNRANMDFDFVIFKVVRLLVQVIEFTFILIILHTDIDK